jgi:hypothetical protein
VRWAEQTAAEQPGDGLMQRSGLGVAALELKGASDRLDLVIDHMLDTGAGAGGDADQLVELRLDRGGVAVLRVLHQEYHRKGDDGGAGVDDDLPPRRSRRAGRWPPKTTTQLNARMKASGRPVNPAMAPGYSGEELLLRCRPLPVATKRRGQTDGSVR